MEDKTFILTRDCKATLIPAGDAIPLAEGTEVFITQALGGTITVQAKGALYRIASIDLDALGAEAQAKYAPAETPANEVSGEYSEEQVWDAMKSCFDPEIPVNIVDLGLVYNLTSKDAESGGKDVFVKMTLTAQGCGMGPSIAADAKAKIEALPAVNTASVDIVWDPVWNPHMISETGREILGINPDA